MDEEAAGGLFAAAFRASRMAMLVTDPRTADNPILFVNDAFTALTGYRANEVVGRNCRFLQGPGTDPQAVARIRDRVALGEAVEAELLNYRKDGTPFWNSLVVSPVRDERGDVVQFFASLYDVSDRRAAADELARTKALLEKEVSRRTRDLEAALDQRTALLHEVEHRVKNNLQVVSSLVLLKARRIHDPAAQTVLHNLAERISALAMVHRLLYPAGDVSRFELADFLLDLTGDLRSARPHVALEVALDVEPTAVPAENAAALALLLNELVGNAVRHAFPDGRAGRLLVRATKPNGHLRIVVEDNGIGMNGVGPPDHGFGKTLIDMFVRQLRGSLTWQDAGPGTRAVVVLPIDAGGAGG